MGSPLGVLATISLALGLFVFPPDDSGKTVVRQLDDEPGLMLLIIVIPLVVAGQVLTATAPMRQGVRRWLGSGPFGVLSRKGTVTTKLGALVVTFGPLITVVGLTNPSYLFPSSRWHAGM